MQQSKDTNKQTSLPSWFKVSLGGVRPRQNVRNLLKDLRLNTVCEGAQCPNLCECWKNGTATFLILGKKCTRNCLFCNIPGGTPEEPEADEPDRICEAARRLDLSYVVVTSVTRDDLDDYGAGHFRAVIDKIHQELPGVGIEVLTPDFNGHTGLLDCVLDARPTVFNHNIETCERLTREIRSDADYQRSLNILRHAASRKDITGTAIKSGLMIGLGEADTEIHDTLADLSEAGVEILTIGQYLAPTKQHWHVSRYVTPDEFNEWQSIAYNKYGFKAVFSAPLVRSSYKAAEAAEKIGRKNDEESQKI